MPASLYETMGDHQRLEYGEDPYFSLLWQGKLDQHTCALSWRWPNITRTSHLCRTFAHRKKSDTSVQLCWQPHSIVCNLELEPVKQRKTDRAAASLRMTHHV